MEVAVGTENLGAEDRIFKAFKVVKTEGTFKNHCRVGMETGGTLGSPLSPSKANPRHEPTPASSVGELAEMAKSWI